MMRAFFTKRWSDGRRAARKQAAAPRLESMEDRCLMTAIPSLFERYGSIAKAGQAATVSLPLTPDRVTAGSTGRVAFWIEVQKSDGSALNLGSLKLLKNGKAVLAPFVKSNGELNSIVALKPDNYSLAVKGAAKSTGDFTVLVHLFGDLNGDSKVNADDLTIFKGLLGNKGTGTLPGFGKVSNAQVQTATKNAGASATPSVTFNFQNATDNVANPTGKPVFADSEIYVAITGKDLSGNFVWVDASGNMHAMALADDTAANHLTKDGRNFSNYFTTLDKVKSGWDVPYGLQGARLWVGLKSPLYLEVNLDVANNIAYTTPDLSNATDPNRDVYWDHIEFATKDDRIQANTTQVDEFGVPLAMTLKNSEGASTVGITKSRQAVFDAYAKVDAGFTSLATAQAPYRIVSPKHGAYNQAQSPTYFDTYINTVWTKFASADWSFANILGTYVGRTSGDSLILHKDNVATNPAITIAKPKTWEIFAAAGNMASGDDTQKAIEAQIVAAFTRHVAENAVQNNDASAPSPDLIKTFYATSPANFYAQFWHTQTVDGRAYGFDFDDVNHQDSSLVGLETTSPGMTVRIGWN